ARPMGLDFRHKYFQQINMAEGSFNLSLHKSELLDRNKSSVDDFLDGLRDGAYRKPIRAIEQLVNSSATTSPDKPLSKHQEESSFHRVGEIVGSLGPFLVLSALTKGAYNKFLG